MVNRTTVGTYRRVTPTQVLLTINPVDPHGVTAQLDETLLRSLTPSVLGIPAPPANSHRLGGWGRGAGARFISRYGSGTVEVRNRFSRMPRGHFFQDRVRL